MCVRAQTIRIDVYVEPREAKHWTKGKRKPGSIHNIGNGKMDVKVQRKIFKRNATVTRKEKQLSSYERVKEVRTLRSNYPFPGMPEHQRTHARV